MREGTFVHHFWYPRTEQDQPIHNHLGLSSPSSSSYFQPNGSPIGLQNSSQNMSSFYNTFKPIFHGSFHQNLSLNGPGISSVSSRDQSCPDPPPPGAEKRALNAEKAPKFSPLLLNKVGKNIRTKNRCPRFRPFQISATPDFGHSRFRPHSQKPRFRPHSKKPRFRPLQIKYQFMGCLNILKNFLGHPGYAHISCGFYMRHPAMHMMVWFFCCMAEIWVFGCMAETWNGRNLEWPKPGFLAVWPKSGFLAVWPKPGMAEIWERPKNASEMNLYLPKTRQCIYSDPFRVPSRIYGTGEENDDDQQQDEEDEEEESSARQLAKEFADRRMDPKKRMKKMLKWIKDN